MEKFLSESPQSAKKTAAVSVDPVAMTIQSCISDALEKAKLVARLPLEKVYVRKPTKAGQCYSVPAACLTRMIEPAISGMFS